MQVTAPRKFSPTHTEVRLGDVRRSLRVVVPWQLNAPVPALILVLTVVLPGLTWLSVDRGVWTWDPSAYAWASIDLFRAALTSPVEWLRLMFGAGQKAPGLWWIGQLFVPVGLVLRSVDDGLLLSILATQTISLLLLYAALRKLTDEQSLVAFAATFPVAAAPLFIQATHLYMVEPLQLLSSSAAVLLLSRARTASVRANASGAVTFICIGLLAKVSSPLYTCIPAAMIVGVTIARFGLAGTVKALIKWPLERHAVAVLALLFATMLWYARSAPLVFSFAAMNTGVQSLEGQFEAPPRLGIAYWLETLSAGYLGPLWPGVAAVLVAGVMLAVTAIIQRFRRGVLQAHDSHADAWFHVCALVALTTCALALVVMANQANGERRFLLPLLPHLSVVLAWILVNSRSRWVPHAMIGLFAVQWVAGNAFALGLGPAQLLGQDPSLISPIRREAERLATLEAVINHTCPTGGPRQRHLVGFEVPWFNNHSLTYTSAKHQLLGGSRCQYESLGFAPFYGPERGWQRVAEVDPEFYLALPFEQVPNSIGNRASQAVLAAVARSPEFVQEAIPGHAEVIAFRRTLPLAQLQPTN